METRTICLTGAVVLSSCLILASHAQTLWQLYGIFFLAGAIGGGALFAPVIALVGGWFRRSAGLAIGIASAGQALGQGLIPFVAGHLIETQGWQAAFTILGAFSAVTLVPLSFVMRQPPPAPATAAVASSGAAPISPAILLPALSLAVLGCCTGMSTPLIHLVPLIQGVCGVGAEAGGPLLVMLVAAIAGRLFFGRLSDVIGPVRAWLAATAWQTALMLGFVMVGTLQSFWIFAPIYGFGYGGVMTGVLTTVRALTPASRRASATGIVLAFGWAGHALGGWQGGVFYDLTDAYFVSFAVATAAGALNLVIVGAIWIALRRRAAPATA